MILLTGKVLRRKRNNQAFTFIELMLVILIIGIIVSVSTPLFQKTFDTIQLENIASNLAKLIRYCGEKAIIERVRYRIVFDDSREGYWLEMEKDPFNHPEGFSRLQSRWGKYNVVPEGIELELEGNTVELYPDGSASPVIIYLTNVREQTCTIKVEEALGHVQIYKGP